MSAAVSHMRERVGYSSGRRRDATHLHVKHPVLTLVWNLKVRLLPEMDWELELGSRLELLLGLLGAIM